MEQAHGLVVCGGQSTRMGRDKSLLDYHGIPQRYFLYRLLQPFCKKVFISCNTIQANNIVAGYEFITDHEKYANIGPMAAILSAFEAYPNDPFLVIGCDHPFIREEDIQQLLKGRDDGAAAVSFFNEEADVYEPLLSIYEKNMVVRLQENFHRQQYSLQSILKEVNSRKILPRNLSAIQSIDTFPDHLLAIEQIKREAAE